MRCCAVNELGANLRTDLIRRQFLQGGCLGLGAMALSQLGLTTGSADERVAAVRPPTRAKRIIYLFMHGGPSQIDLFDYKPRLTDWHGEELPPSVRGEQRLTGMTSNQKTKPLVSSA